MSLSSKHTSSSSARWNCHPAWNFWSCYHKFWPNKWHSSVPKTNKVEAVGPCPYVELLYSVLAACYAFPYLNHSMKRKCVKTNTSCTLQQKMALNIFVWELPGRAIWFRFGGFFMPRHSYIFSSLHSSSWQSSFFIILTLRHFHIWC